MGSGKDLIAEVQAVAWGQNILARPGAEASLDRVGNATGTIALWARQLETSCNGEAALSFVRAMHLEAMYAGIQIALALYKPAANAMRSMVESALYFSYFRTHPSELSTLVRDSAFFVDKAEILDFHKRHTANFIVAQNSLNLIGELNAWYSRMSAIVHGQVPGKWVSHMSIRSVSANDVFESEAADEFEIGVRLVNQFFLCTISQDSHVWDGIDVGVRKVFLKGLAGPVKQALALDVL